jgi:hypothetical protein
MIEIIIIISLCRRIAEAARKKGRGPTGYRMLLVFFWFGGEIIGAMLTAVLLALDGQEFDDNILIMYAGAFAGAALGALLAFKIVSDLTEPRSDEQMELDRGY